MPVQGSAMKKTTKKNLLCFKLMVLTCCVIWIETIYGQENQSTTGDCVSCVQTALMQDLKEIEDHVMAELATILKVVNNPDCHPQQKRYAFYAQREKNMMYQPQDETNHVTYNSNDHTLTGKESNQKSFFDIDSGRFTAPEDGTYFFEFHALKAARWNSASRSDMPQCIVKLVKEVADGKEIATIIPIAEGKVVAMDWYSSFPIQIEAIVDLKEGEKISVRLYDGELQGGWLTSFTGFLIAPKKYPIECEFDVTPATTMSSISTTAINSPSTDTTPTTTTPANTSPSTDTTPTTTTPTTITPSITFPTTTTPSTTTPSTSTPSATTSSTTTPLTTIPSTTTPLITSPSTSKPPPCECHGQGSKCRISVAAAENMACKCISSETISDAKCTGEDVPCANPGSSYCKNPDKTYLSCLQGRGNCGDYERQTTASLQGCECGYRMPNGLGRAGGCIITDRSPKKHACNCHYTVWACYGTVELCQDYNSEKCTNPDDTLSSCEQGGGDCGGYLEYHSRKFNKKSK